MFGICEPRAIRSGLGFLEQAGAHRTDHAGSIASLMLTAEALIAEIPEKKEAPIRAVDTAAAWATCTKGAIGFQPVSKIEKPRCRERAFLSKSR